MCSMSNWCCLVVCLLTVSRCSRRMAACISSLRCAYRGPSGLTLVALRTPCVRLGYLALWMHPNEMIAVS